MESIEKLEHNSISEIDTVNTKAVETTYKYNRKLNKVLYLYSCAMENGCSVLMVILVCFCVWFFGCYSTNTLHWGFILVLIAFVVMGLLAILLNKACNLKAYGLSKEMTVYTIDLRNEIVVPVRFVGVTEVGADMLNTLFECTVIDAQTNETAEYLHGLDIFFSYEDAQLVLKHIMTHNDLELQQYFPNWRADAVFVKYYKNTMTQYGFENTVTSDVRTQAIINNALIINGITYKSCYSIENYLREFLDFVQKKQKEKQAKQTLIDAIKEYQSKKQ